MDAWDKIRKEREYFQEQEKLRIEREKLDILKRKEQAERSERTRREQDQIRANQLARLEQQKPVLLSKNKGGGGGCLSVIIFIAFVALGFYYYLSPKQSSNVSTHSTTQEKILPSHNEVIPGIHVHDNQTMTNNNSQDSEATKSNIKTINKMF